MLTIDKYFLIYLWIGSVWLICGSKSIAGTENIPLLLNPSDSAISRVDSLNELAYQKFYKQPELTRQYAEEALSIAISNNDLIGIATAQWLIAISYRSKGQYASFVDWIKQSTITCKAMPEAPDILHANINNSIGLLFTELKQWNKALKYFEIARDKIGNTDHNTRKIIILLNYSLALVESDEVERAATILEEAQAMIKKAQATEMHPLISFYEGKLKIKQGDLNSALKTSQSGLDECKKTGEKFQCSNILVNLSNIYYQQNKLDDALLHAQKALMLARETERIDLKMEVCQSLYKIYEARRDYENAYRAQSRYLTLRNNLATEDLAAKMEAMEWQLQLYERDQENEKLKQEEVKKSERLHASQSIIKKQRTVTIIILIALIVKVILIVIILIKQKQVSKAKTDAEYKKSELEATLTMVEKLNNKLDVQSRALNKSAIVAILDEQNQFKEANDNLLEALGYEFMEIKQKPIVQFLSETDRSKFEREIQTQIAANDTWRGELMMLTRHGEPYYVDAVFIPMINDIGEKELYTIQFDISSRKRYEDALKHKNKELNQLNQLKNKLFSIVSHDFRSPLKTLKGTLQLAAKGAITAEELKPQSKALLEKVERTSAFLDNLLNWAKSQMTGAKVKPETLALKSLAEEVLQLMGTQAEKKTISLVNHVPDNLYAFADREMIKLVLRNLISNGLKFTGEKGSVTISAEQHKKEVIISVADTGVGIDDARMGKLFKLDNYSTVGTANELGVGLGLLLCQDFVSKNKGRIWVESEESKGSTFSFTLPISQPDTQLAIDD